MRRRTHDWGPGQRLGDSTDDHAAKRQRSERPAVEHCRGNLISSDAQYICHQTNTDKDAKHTVELSGPALQAYRRKKARGLAAQIFRRFPYSHVLGAGDTYATRHQRIGRATIHGDGAGKRFVVSLFGQLGCRPNKRYGELIDSNVNRLRWFKAALRDFEAQAHSPARPPLTSVAFPDKIGCGLAGGRWSDYLHEIEEFKRRNPLVRVIVIEYSE